MAKFHSRPVNACGSSRGKLMARLPLLLLLTASTLLTGAQLPLAARADGRGVSGLTSRELHELQRGKLISRPVQKHRGEQRLMGGTSYQVIDAPLHVVWAALLDTPRYPRMMPEVVEARLVRSQGTQRTVFVKQGTLPLLRVSYYLDVRVNESRHDIEFRLDESRPHDLQSAFGFYNLRPFDDGRTLLTYGIMADIGGGLFAAVARDSVHEWMLKTPWMVKRFIEGSGRQYYSF